MKMHGNTDLFCSWNLGQLTRIEKMGTLIQSSRQNSFKFVGLQFFGRDSGIYMDTSYQVPISNASAKCQTQAISFQFLLLRDFLRNGKIFNCGASKRQFLENLNTSPQLTVGKHITKCEDELRHNTSTKYVKS